MAGRAAGRLLPILGWLPFYQRTSLLPDVLAGLAVWAVMVPESMAYAGIVGAPAIMGLVIGQGAHGGQIRTIG